MAWALSQGGGRGRWYALRRWRWCPVAAVLLIALATPAAAAEYALSPAQQAVGEIGRYVTKQGDVFPDIARHFDIGYTALVSANPGVDPWVPGVGRTITIPSLFILPDAPRRGIVINLAQWRLFYFPPEGNRVFTFPLGLGVIGRKTPLGATRIVYKEPNPAWYPPPSIRAERPDLPAMIPPGPDNPLGAFALHLGWKNYLIHGTNKPDGVGRNVSHGCIRLYPEDIEKLFGMVGVGTPVQVVDQPATAGWIGDALYVSVYPSKAQTEDIDIERPVSRDPAGGVARLVTEKASTHADTIDSAAVAAAAARRTGMPVRVAGGPAPPGYQQLDVREAPQPPAPQQWSYERESAPPQWGYDRESAPPRYSEPASPYGYGTAQSYGIDGGRDYRRAAAPPWYPQSQ